MGKFSLKVFSFESCTTVYPSCLRMDNVSIRTLNRGVVAILPATFHMVTKGETLSFAYWIIGICTCAQSLVRMSALDLFCLSVLFLAFVKVCELLNVKRMILPHF